jgi:cytochrome c-type biogenesis protein CcmF
MRGTVTYSQKGVIEGQLFPEKRNYFSSAMPMTQAAIKTSWNGDRYVSLGEPLENGDWSVRFYYKPFVDWIWIGCLLMAAGGVLAASDRRYRIASGKESVQ